MQEALPDSDTSSSSDDESVSDLNFRPEDIEHLLKAVRATMDIEEPREEKTIET